MNHNYYIYILECSDGSYYTGVTNNVEKRVAEHEAGIDTKCYTFSRRPLALAYYEHTTSIVSAITREKQIKRWSRKKKVALINDNIEALKDFSTCNNTTSSRNFNKQ